MDAQCYKLRFSLVFFGPTNKILRLYLKIDHDCVGTSHSATGAIEPALKYVSPDAHWIARHLATAGGKTYKNAAPQRNQHRPHSAVTATSYYQLPLATASTSQQHSYPSSDRRPARGSTTRRSCTSLAGRYKSPRCLITSAATALPASAARSQSAAARSNIQAPRTTRPPRRTGNSTRFSSANYPLTARRTSPVAVRAAPKNLPYTIRPFSGPSATGSSSARIVPSASQWWCSV
jgi:hypothetical protein